MFIGNKSDIVLESQAEVALAQRVLDLRRELSVRVGIGRRKAMQLMSADEGDIKYAIASAADGFSDLERENRYADVLDAIFEAFKACGTSKNDALVLNVFCGRKNGWIENVLFEENGDHYVPFGNYVDDLNRCAKWNPDGGMFPLGAGSARNGIEQLADAALKALDAAPMRELDGDVVFPGADARPPEPEVSGDVVGVLFADRKGTLKRAWLNKTGGQFVFPAEPIDFQFTKPLI